MALPDSQDPPGGQDGAGTATEEHFLRPLPELGVAGGGGGGFLGDGGMGEVYRDPENPDQCIKKLRNPLPVTDPKAQRLIRLTGSSIWARPGDATTLTSRFSWPIECFGPPLSQAATAQGDEIHGYSMPVADSDRCYFDLQVGAGDPKRSLSQTKFFTDEDYWQGAAVQSAQPDFSAADRRELAIDIIEAMRTLRHYGLAFGDISSNNVCVKLGSPSEVFILDADSIGTPSEIEPIRTPGWTAPEGLDPYERDSSLTALLIWRLFTGKPSTFPSPGIPLLIPIGASSVTSLIISAYESGSSEPLLELTRQLRRLRTPAEASVLLDRAKGSRIARFVIREFDERTGADNLRSLSAARAQRNLEDEIDSATGTERRRLTRRAALSGSEFVLDVLPDLGVVDRPNSQGQLRDLIYNAQFVALATHLATGGLGTDLENDDWLPRAVQHAIVQAGDTTIESTAEPGQTTLTWTWPTAGFVNAALLDLISEGQTLSRQVIVRRPGDTQGVAHATGETAVTGRVLVRFAVKSLTGNLFVGFEPVSTDFQMIPRPAARPRQRPTLRAQEHGPAPISPLPPRVEVVDPVQAAADLAAIRQGVRQRRKKQIFVSTAAGLALLGITWAAWTPVANYFRSSDGRQMVFASDRDGDWEIYVRDHDSTVRQLTRNNYDDRNPSWSPDGKHIGFEADYDGDWELLRMNADGSDVRTYFFNQDADIDLRWKD